MMRLVLQLILILLTVTGSVVGAPYKRPSSFPPNFDPNKEGQALAAKLRSAVPTEDGEFQGKLELTTPNGKMSSVPVISTITLGRTNWQVVYKSESPATAASSKETETLTIEHRLGFPTSYTLAIGTNAPLPVQQNRPFAGSDFGVLDLGLEFFHWPNQRLLRREMSRGRPCRVLESVNPNPAPGAYARVISWIDNESGGVLQARAYDSQAKQVKYFKLGSFKKVNGKWKLRDMNIENKRTNHRTVLRLEHPGTP
jgi:hypothetical protein